MLKLSLIVGTWRYSLCSNVMYCAAASVAEAFVKLHNDGLIYKGSYMVNWSPAMLTAVSDLEVEYTEEAGFLYYFK